MMNFWENVIWYKCSKLVKTHLLFSAAALSHCWSPNISRPLLDVQTAAHKDRSTICLTGNSFKQFFPALTVAIKVWQVVLMSAPVLTKAILALSSILVTSWNFRRVMGSNFSCVWRSSDRIRPAPDPVNVHAFTFVWLASLFRRHALLRCCVRARPEPDPDRRSCRARVRCPTSTWNVSKCFQTVVFCIDRWELDVFRCF